MSRTIEDLGNCRKDFEVRYKFFSPENGGRKTGPPFQFYRSDWMYDGDDVKTELYVIWPVFVDNSGKFIEPEKPVPVEGTAQMFILNAELRSSVHAKRLAVGVRGFFMEGPNRVAEATVTKLLAIKDEDVSRRDT